MKTTGEVWALAERVQAKLLGREWLGALLFVGMAGFITYHCWRLPGSDLWLPSMYPFRAAFFFAWMQYFPVLFLSASFFFKGKIDTSDSLLVRPASNVARFTAAAAAVVHVTLLWATLAFAGVLLANIFAGDAPCDPGLYLYYLLTLVLPATVFMTGFAFLLFAGTRNAAAGFVSAILLAWITLNLSGESWTGILNFTGINLPNEYSEITGFTPRGTYALHRIGWLAAGIGMVFLAALFDRRPENNSAVRKRTRLAGAGILLAGIACLVGMAGIQERKHARRATLAEIYNRHAGKTALHPENIDIEVTAGDGRLEGKARLRARNNSSRRLEEFPLYLNPGLRVSRLGEGNKELPFRREGQVILVTRNTGPGETITIEVEYEGGIDENVFYLDIPEKTVREAKTWNEGLCHKGKAYFFLDERQVVLFPEALWYPTTAAPVNPKEPYASRVHFSNYSLDVKVPDGMTVIAQGKREERNGRVKFTPEHPLTGISLVAGQYEKREYRLDSTLIELYLYPGHYQLAIAHFEPHAERIARELPSQLREFPEQLPLARLCLAETPRTLHAYHRDRHEGSNLVQPELICFPEKMPKGWSGKKEVARMLGGKYSGQYNVANMLVRRLTENKTWNPQEEPRMWLEKFTSGKQERDNKEIPNLLYAFPLAERHARVVRHDSFPGLDILLRYVEKKNYFMGRPHTIPQLKETTRELVARNSLRELLLDPRVSSSQLQEIFSAKAQEFFLEFLRRGVPALRMERCLERLLEKRQFCAVELGELQAVVRRELGIDLRDVLERVYDNRPGEPVLLIKDVKAEIRRTAEDSRRRKFPTRVSFVVFNDSEVEGEITVRYLDLPVPGTNLTTQLFKTYTIPPGEGRRIAFYVPTSGYIALYPPLSSPTEPRFGHDFSEKVRSISDTRTWEEPITREEFFAGEIIVDDSDKGFSVPRPEIPLLQRWTGKKTKTSIYIHDAPGWYREQRGFGYVEPYARGCVAGMGSGEASWQVDLPRAGRYELFAFISGVHVVWSFNRLAYKKKLEQLSPLFQLYTVEHGGKKSEVSVELLTPSIGLGWSKPKDTWYSLGTYDLPAGTARVILHDKGIKDQIIWADAVKWVEIK